MESEQFLESLASDAAAPGGGGGSAYTAAIGVSLSEMALNISLKTAKADDVELMNEVIPQLAYLRKKFYQMIDADAEAFLPLSQAYKLPKTDPLRDDKIQAGLVSAAKAPLELMRLSYHAIRQHKKALTLSSKMMVSDVGTGVIISLSALKGAHINVLVNSRLMTSDGYRKTFEDEANHLLEDGSKIADYVYSEVLKLMR
ncbi:cyclodeaminase/cyclohydrolase family protein [Fundicoccus culcitae]|uniref:Cyclodeaminase/cyclohydrolase family protein n=1 Tax=Fundicoccus culcitae TaxID=2969821 RepID=A0ABY5P518_9LACT|nr:cyclodeaminase/cyclohydrolase family protein [Fundicoccus culcitae]UUX33575.1 cyclodeaminase/cyclohydrolase family protein [Fundicoccus culcitae]